MCVTLDGVKVEGNAVRLIDGEKNHEIVVSMLRV